MWLAVCRTCTDCEINVTRKANDLDTLQLIDSNPALRKTMRSVCEFDLDRTYYGEPLHLPSGAALECIAGDFAGGSFFLCGDSETRPVLYASSEGQAGLIGASLIGAVEVMIGLPYWRDCLGYSGDGDLDVMLSAAGYLSRDERRDHPDIDHIRADALAALSLQGSPVPSLMVRLRDAVKSTAPDYVLTTESGDRLESLFGPWHPSRNPLWR